MDGKLNSSPDDGVVPALMAASTGEGVIPSLLNSGFGAVGRDGAGTDDNNYPDILERKIYTHFHWSFNFKHKLIKFVISFHCNRFSGKKT